MKIELKKFGKLLISRPAGKEAFAVAKAYIFPNNMKDPIILDFAGVEVFSPSWADEFITGLKKTYPNIKIEYLNTQNQSVKATLETLASFNLL